MQFDSREAKFFCQAIKRAELEGRIAAIEETAWPDELQLEAEQRITALRAELKTLEGDKDDQA